MEVYMKNIKNFVLKNKKSIIISLVCIMLAVVLISINSNNNDKNNDIISENSAPINLGLEDNKVFGLLKGTVIGAKIPQDVLYRSLISFIEDNNIEGIDNLVVDISSKGMLLKAEYTLLNFIKIPAEFTLVPSKEDSLLTLSVENVKIMNLKIKIDKIIEKWITANEEIQEVLKYNEGKLTVDISKVAPVAIDSVFLEDGLINLSCEII